MGAIEKGKISEYRPLKILFETVIMQHNRDQI